MKTQKNLSILLTLVMLLGLLPWSAQSARAADDATVVYTFAWGGKDDNDYYLSGSDGTQSARFNRFNSSSVELSIENGLTLRLATADYTKLVVVDDSVGNSNARYQYVLKYSADLRITHASHYIKHVKLYGQYVNGSSCSITSQEADFNAHTCDMRWMKENSSRLCAIEITYSERQDHYSIDTLLGYRSSEGWKAGDYGTVTLSPGTGGFVGGETVTASVTSAPGYTLASLTALDGKGRAVPITDGSFVMPYANVTLTATFASFSYSVHYEANGGTGTMEDESCYGRSALSASRFSRAGYFFTSWNTKSDGSGASFAPGDNVAAFASENGTLTLYAQWKATGADDPFRVTSLAELNSLAARVNAGEDFTGVYILQTGDITGFTGTIGTDEHPFRGIYDGGENTLAVDISGGRYCAPFGCVENASIRKLTVAGSIAANSETIYEGGLIGFAEGDLVAVENCSVTASVTGGGGGFVGGFVGGRGCTFTITNCVFRGSLLGSATRAAGFCGGAACVDCLFAPAAVTIETEATDYTFGEFSEELTRCYYVTALGTAQGAKVSTAAPEGSLSAPVTLHGETYYGAASISGLRAIYAQTGGVIHPKPVVRAFDGTVLTENTHYTVAYSAEDDSALDDYTLTVTGMGAYVGKQVFGYSVTENLGNWIDCRASGELSTEISTAEQLALLAYNVNNGNRYKDVKFYLTADIDLSGHYWTPIGSSKTNCFSGSFYGNGHTISGLAIDPANKPTYGGLFGVMAAQTYDPIYISGIVLTDCNIAGASSTGTVAGLLHGNAYNYIESCLVLGGTVSGGALVGVTETNSRVRNSYYEGLSLNGGEPASSAHHCVRFDDGSVNEDRVTVRNGSAEYRGVFYQGALYVGDGMIVRTIPAVPAGMVASGVTYSDGSGQHDAAAEDGGAYSFTMPAADVSVSVKYAPCALAGRGTASEPYVIGSADDWAYLVARPGLYGASFRLAQDLSVSSSLGTSSSPFTGVFDGGGNTLTVTLTAAGEGCAPFGYANGASIRNLHTAGTVTMDNNKYGSGVIGVSDGCVSITNCRSSVAVSSSVDGDGSHGGLVGLLNGGELTITGCVFDGSITGEKTTNCGGFVGWRNGVLTIENSLMAGKLEINVDDNSATFSRNGDAATISSCYYLTAYGAAQGIKAQRVTPGTNVSLGGVGGTQYSASGITAYEKSLLYGGAICVGAGETISLTLRCGAAPEGMVLDSYAADAGTLSGTANPYTLVMPAEGDVTISVKWKAADRTVRFDKNADNAALGEESRTLKYGDPYGALPEASRGGYTLAGWFTARTGGTQIKADTSAKFNGTQTLYAHWTANEYTIAYNTDGGSVLTAQTYTPESEKALPTPTKAGFTFSCWKVTTAAGSWEKDAELGAGAPLKGRYGSVTLTAQWEKIAVSVGGDVSGSTFQVSATAPEGGLLIAAVYDGSGRQVSVMTYTLTANNAQQAEDTRIAVKSGYTYRVMLVDAGTYVPLCEAWSKTKE